MAALRAEAAGSADAGHCTLHADSPENGLWMMCEMDPTY
jgi:hypothetical protein